MYISNKFHICFHGDFYNLLGGFVSGLEPVAGIDTPGKDNLKTRNTDIALLR